VESKPFQPVCYKGIRKKNDEPSDMVRISFVILSLTQLYRYTPEIFLFSTATFKYTYRANWTRKVSERGLLKISVNETDTATSVPV
jgi:hypothetical protein